MRKHVRTILASALAAAGLMVPASPASAATACTYLGNLPDQNGDDLASIAGASASGEYAVGASEDNGRFLWRNGQTVATWPTMDGDKRDTPKDVNSSGTVTGHLTPRGGPSEPYVWRPGSGSKVKLATVSGSTYTEAVAINDTGDVVGLATVGGDYSVVVWPASDYSTYRVVGQGRPVSIDNDGRILLTSKKMLYPDGTLHDLQTPAGVSSFSITESDNGGRPVGYGTDTSGGEVAIVWNSDGSVLHTRADARPVAANTAGDTVGLVKSTTTTGYDAGFWGASGAPVIFPYPDPLAWPGDIYLGDNNIVHAMWVTDDYQNTYWARWSCS